VRARVPVIVACVWRMYECPGGVLGCCLEVIFGVGA
jgi:hypothetical protein